MRLPDNVLAGGELGLATNIREFKTALEAHGLFVTVRAGFRLWAIADRLEVPTYGPFVTPADVAAVRDAAGRLEDTLRAEAGGLIVFTVTERRIDSRKLLDSPGALLAENVYYQLPRLPASDFANACRAIAFALPTAGAFHLLRGIEGALRHYYKCVIRRGRLPAQRQMWHVMIEKLRARRGGKATELLDTLDRIRVNFRNPTLHPEKDYDLDEVQDLFGLAVDALNRMVKSSHWAVPADSIRALIEGLERDYQAAQSREGEEDDGFNPDEESDDNGP